MRFNLAVSFLVAVSSVSAGAAFAPFSSTSGLSSWGVAVSPARSSFVFQQSTISETEAVEATASDNRVVAVHHAAAPSSNVVALTSEEVKSRLTSQLEKLRQKDSKSKKLSKEDIKVVYEDDYVIVVNKPTGVLCVGGPDGHPNLADAVCESFNCEMGRSDKMVVHRLGMDTSGLIVFAKTMQAMRDMNAMFRSRKIERTYEALVCGHIEKDESMINLPLMRDYEFPPFMRISTDAHQRALVDLDPEQVGKKLVEAPKESLTKYRVIAREEYQGNPVTRVALTSITGRTHQLNVHMAAFGHPLVGDTTYGINGAAAPNGGLSAGELNSLAPNAARADASLQQAIAKVAKTTCVHAKSLKFRHPVTKQDVSLSVDASF